MLPFGMLVADRYECEMLADAAAAEAKPKAIRAATTPANNNLKQRPPDILVTIIAITSRYVAQVHVVIILQIQMARVNVTLTSLLFNKLAIRYAYIYVPVISAASRKVAESCVSPVFSLKYTGSLDAGT